MKIWTGNNIGDSGAIILSESLKNNTTLTELWLNGEYNEWWIMIEEGDEWCDERTDNSIGGEGARMIIEFMKSNTSLKIHVLGRGDFERGQDYDKVNLGGIGVESFRLL